MNDISSKVPHYTPNMAQDGILSKHSISRARTVLSYIERSFFK